MNVSCGVDLIRISRIEKAVQKYGGSFMNRIWTAQEQQIATTAASLAARFAGKEALAKALGSGIGPSGVSWTDLEILKNKNGAPEVQLHGAARLLYEQHKGISLSLSLSHDGDLAQAFCVMLCINPLGELNTEEVQHN